MYDHENQQHLEGEARAAAFWLGKVLGPVQQRLSDELEAFTLEDANPEQCRARLELEALLAAMQAYCEAVQTYNDQLLVNLTHAEEVMHAEARSAAFFKRQFALTHADLQREQQRSTDYLTTFQEALARKNAA